MTRKQGSEEGARKEERKMLENNVCGTISVLARRNFSGTQISRSVTVTEKAGEDMADCRNRAAAYDKDGNVILAQDGKKPVLGIALIEAGGNDISGAESGRVRAGDDVDIQIKDTGYILAGAEIAKGDEVTAGAGGLGVPAASGDYVLGTAMGASKKYGFCRIQVTKYQKA